ncbi:hypothetical protein [Streptomyces plicatus]|uniref:Uncharacterized protein n=1 Tax=Streptomyces plicatus TaxID=1922 RepID=A0ABW1XRW8_STRPL
MAQEDPGHCSPVDALGGLGPLARQLNQVHNRLWHERVHQDVTGPQFTVLSLLDAHGDMDQGPSARSPVSTSRPPPRCSNGCAAGGCWTSPGMRATAGARW